MTFKEFKEEFNRPLGSVRSNWLRRSVLLILTIPLLILYIIVGILNGVGDFVMIALEVWNGQ